MPVVGKMGYHEVPLTIEKLDSGLSGEFSYTARQAGGEIAIHPDNRGVYMLDSVIHELLHASGRFRGIEGRKFNHVSIYTLAGDLAEWLTTSGVVDPVAFEKRLRVLARKTRKKSK